MSKTSEIRELEKKTKERFENWAYANFDAFVEGAVSEGQAEQAFKMAGTKDKKKKAFEKLLALTAYHDDIARLFFRQEKDCRDNPLADMAFKRWNEVIVERASKTKLSKIKVEAEEATFFQNSVPDRKCEGVKAMILRWVELGAALTDPQEAYDQVRTAFETTREGTEEEAIAQAKMEELKALLPTPDADDLEADIKAKIDKSTSICELADLVDYPLTDEEEQEALRKLDSLLTAQGY